MSDTDVDKDKAKGAPLEFSDEQKAYIAKVIRKERRRHETELADLRDELKPDPGGKERPFDQEKDGDPETQQLRRKVSELEAAREQDKLMAAARDAAIDAGVDAKRVRRFLRLAELDGVKSTDTDAIEEAIADAVKDAPEFVATSTDKTNNKTDDDADKSKKDPADGRPKASTVDDEGKPPAKTDPDVTPGLGRMTAAYAESGT